jgi:hypothetical protein
VGTVRALTRWIAKYGDEIVAILLTLVLFVLGWQDIVGATAINNTILLVLAVMIAGTACTSECSASWPAPPRYAC